MIYSWHSYSAVELPPAEGAAIQYVVDVCIADDWQRRQMSVWDLWWDDDDIQADICHCVAAADSGGRY